MGSKNKFGSLERIKNTLRKLLRKILHLDTRETRERTERIGFRAVQMCTRVYGVQLIDGKQTGTGKYLKKKENLEMA